MHLVQAGEEVPEAGVRAVLHGVHGEGVGGQRGALYRVRHKHAARGWVRLQEPLRELGSENLVQDAPCAPRPAGHQRPCSRILTEVDGERTRRPQQVETPENEQQIPVNAAHRSSARVPLARAL